MRRCSDREVHALCVHQGGKRDAGTKKGPTPRAKSLVRGLTSFLRHFVTTAGFLPSRRPVLRQGSTLRRVRLPIPRSDRSLVAAVAVRSTSLPRYQCTKLPRFRAPIPVDATPHH